MGTRKYNKMVRTMNKTIRCTKKGWLGTLCVLAQLPRIPTPLYLEYLFDLIHTQFGIESFLAFFVKM